MTTLYAPLCAPRVEASGADLATAPVPSRVGTAKSAPWPGFEHGMGLGGWLTNYKRFNVLPDKWRFKVTQGDLEHFETYISEADVERILDWGFDHVRLGFDQIVLEASPGVWRESAFRKLGEFVG